MDKMKWQRSVTRSISTCLLAGLACLLLSSWVTGQEKQYKQMKNFVEPAKVRQLERSVKSIINSPSAPTKEQQRTLGTYYVNYVLSGMSRPDAWDDPERFPDWRKQILTDLHAMSANPETHRFVRDLIYKYAVRLAADAGYAPATRYNAVLLIGALNDREMSGGGRNMTPAVPHSKSRAVLLQIVKSSKQPQFMKVGAMIGLGRHARLIAASGGTPDQNLTRAMADVLKWSPDSPEMADGLWWMQRIAVDSLGHIGIPAAAPLLEDVVVDQTRPVYLRCAAADALGRLDMRQAKVKHGEIARGLGQLAVSALKTQIVDIQNHLQENPIDEGRARYRAAGEEEEEKKEDPFVLLVRRQLTHEMRCVLKCISALQSSSGSADAKNTLTSLESEVKTIVKELTTEGANPQELLNMITQPALRLESAVNRNARARPRTLRS